MSAMYAVWTPWLVGISLFGSICCRGCYARASLPADPAKFLGKVETKVGLESTGDIASTGRKKFFARMCFASSRRGLLGTLTRR